jgi:hypothetical protein
MEASPRPWPALGVLLLRDGLVTKEDLEAVLGDQRDARRQRISGSRLGELLVERGMVTREQVAKLVAEQYELPFLELDEIEIDPHVIGLLSEELARQFHAVPISELRGGSLLLAIGDPATVLFAEDLRRALGVPLRFAVVPQLAMESAIAYVYSERLLDLANAEDENVVVDLHEDPSQAHAVAQGDGESYLGSPTTVTRLWPALGALLVRDGLVTHEELDSALAQQRLSGGKRLGEVLVERGSVTRADVARVVAEQYELPFVDLAWPEVDPQAAALLPEEVARRYSALPVNFDVDGSLRVAISDPAAVLYSDELRVTLGVPLTFAVASPDAIESALDQAREHAPPDGRIVETPAPPATPEDDVPFGEPERPSSLHPTVDEPWESPDLPERETDQEVEGSVPASVTEVDDALVERLRAAAALEDVDARDLRGAYGDGRDPQSHRERGVHGRNRARRGLPGHAGVP